MLHITDKLTSPKDDDFEFVECKGRGHPDSLTDAIADELSRRYSRFTLLQFGRICNHWVDKCVLIGGQSAFTFGESRMVSPMRLLVIGKATTQVDGVPIPLEEMATECATDVLSSIISNFEPADLRVDVLTNDYQGAGRPKSWYRPGPGVALPPATANDAVICAGFYPFSPTEAVTRALAELFFQPDVRAEFPYVGTDIKILSHRRVRHIDITACVPFVASLTPSRAFYDAALEEVRGRLAEEVRATVGDAHTFSIHLNTRDDAETVYMSHYGSCVDTGDVGAVGRGNRGSGLITPSRPMSIEAPAGKNPRYHSGKILDIAAFNMARSIYEATGHEAEVTISTQTGRPLSAPAAVVVHLRGGIDPALERRCAAIVDLHLEKIDEVTAAFVRQPRAA
jgi:S-adenosylmethionine synthetase